LQQTQGQTDKEEKKTQTELRSAMHRVDHSDIYIFVATLLFRFFCPEDNTLVL